MKHESRMDAVLVMSQDRNLPRDLRTRLRRYFQNSRRLHRISDYGEISMFMSPALQGEVALRVTRKYLRRIDFLVNAENEFIVRFAKALRMHLFPPNEWIVPDSIPTNEDH